MSPRGALLLVALSTPFLGGARGAASHSGNDAADLASVLEVPSGSSRVVTVPGIAKVAIGDQSVADVKAISSSQVLVNGRQDGRTTLMIWKENGQRVTYTVVVRKIDPVAIVEEIRKLLGDIAGINVHIVGDHIYMDGSAYTQEDYDRVQSVMEIYPNVRSFVKISPNAKKLVANNLSAQFQRAGMKNVNARVVGSTIFLEGTVESQEELKRAELITKALGEKVENLLTVGLRKMIMADVQFVELRKNAQDQLGINWPFNFSGQTTGTVTYGGNLPQTGTPTGAWSFAMGPLTAATQLSLLLEHGYARLLAQPKLVCASGEKAEFLAGGEIPIVYTTFNVSEVEWKEYGVILKLEPTADAQGNIEMKLEGEVSEIDTSVSVSQGTSVSIPGFRVRRFRSTVGVKHGEAIMLSGVFEHEEQKNVNKVPPFSYIPILGELFKQHVFTETKEELVIFVRPYIISPESERVVKMIKDMEQRYKEAKDEVDYSIFD